MRRIVNTTGRGRRPLAVMLVALAALLLGTGAAQAAREPRAVDCSEATAQMLVERFGLNNFIVDDPVEQVLCGPFAGEGSEAMAITIGSAPTCWPVQRWAVARYVGGDWQLVLDRYAFLSAPLVAVGGDLREATPAFRIGDPRCVPSAGTHTRTWHWDGARLVAGPWDADRDGKPLKQFAFIDPKGVQCAILD